jgi:transposase
MKLNGGWMAVQQSSGTVGARNVGTKRFRTTEERRQIVEETQKPGASVSVVARAHDVNANQVFKWRKLYREGRLEIAATSNTTSTLLPVKICESAPMPGSAPVRRRVKAQRAGIIDIDLGHARLRIEGAADPDCVRASLEELKR